ncbi:Transcriptional activator hac1 [Metarhizium album ARSEF 1941]|uniref:Transcriptional activator hac1 n=1 Tax=Metarhizium album (strain ARSEF 1941) TaxID=1081103 RepID=A0A0B2WW91_METAS|nr:Transcriptional activator hac1 [Metarhizium album ARSEF 1941]KHO00467.1 Transcriptional activator hac1 [Metarhizium album ARSEF 1941]
MTVQPESPVVKFEASPAESFLSVPGDNYPSLFAPSTPTSTINPLDVMTPKSFSEDRQTPQLPAVSEENAATPGAENIPASSEKKPTKKRKSWGQVLPEPKTNLPPRKRAKTEDEKEQRRVERVLRNRRAAQSSRERKRLEVEALEHRNKELEEMLLNAQKANLILVEELNRLRRESGVVTPSSSPFNSHLRDALSLSQELFSSQDGHDPSTDPAANLVDQLIKSTANPTVNPASLSPELSPVPEGPKTDEASTEAQSDEQNLATSPDLTQHPAEMLSDLQCHKSAKNDTSSSLGDSFRLPETLDTDRHVLQSHLLASPISSTIDDHYLAGDSPISEQEDLDFNIDDFLNDEANHVASDIMAASDFAAADHGFESKVHELEIQVP